MPAPITTVRQAVHPPSPTLSGLGDSIHEPGSPAIDVAVKVNNILAANHIPLYVVCSRRGFTWRRIAQGQPCVPGHPNSYYVTKQKVREILHLDGVHINWRYSDAGPNSVLHQIAQQVDSARSERSTSKDRAKGKVTKTRTAASAKPVPSKARLLKAATDDTPKRSTAVPTASNAPKQLPQPQTKDNGQKANIEELIEGAREVLVRRGISPHTLSRLQRAYDKALKGDTADLEDEGPRARAEFDVRRQEHAEALKRDEQRRQRFEEHARGLAQSHSEKELKAKLRKAKWNEREGLRRALEIVTEDRGTQHNAESASFPSGENGTPESSGKADSSPYTLEELTAIHKRIASGEITADELRSAFERTLTSEQSVKAELAKKTLKELAPRGTGGRKKGEILKLAWQDILSSFTIGPGFTWSPFTETYEHAVRRIVAKVTDEEIQRAASERRERREKFTKSITNPETYEEYSFYVELKGEKSLTTEQRATWDRLQADRELSSRQAETERKAVVQKVNANVSFRMIEGRHTKRDIPLWIVQLEERVDGDTFKDLLIKAKKLGGWYSSYVKGQSGFQFEMKEDAERFMALREGDVSRIDKIEERNEERRERATERLREVAESTEERAQEVLSAERKTNTHRRAEMAASIEGRARTDLAIAETMQRIADAIERGEVKYLTRVRAKAQIETLESVLRDAKWKAVIANPNENGKRDHDRAILDSDINFAEYPKPRIRTAHLDDLVREAQGISGAKQLSKRVAKYAVALNAEGRHTDDWNPVVPVSWIEAIEELCSKVGSRSTAVHWIREGLAKWKRLAGMGITSSAMLREALREYWQYREKPREEDPIKKLERELIGTKIDGYFPTPPAIAEQLVEAADIDAGDDVLEPSAGKGSIADVIRAKHPDAHLDVIEVSNTLRSMLEMKGYKLVASDFLDYSERKYDAIVMNPPFEHGKDIDHVRHAWDLLKPGGRLVAIVSEGPFYRPDKKAQGWRAFLEEHDATSERLPEGSFLDSERSTSVNTRIVTLTKPHGEESQREEPQSTFTQGPHIEGNATVVHTRTEEIPARFVVVELDSLIVSHNERTFSPNPAYPTGCQQRDYTNDRAEQLKVLENAKHYKPQFVAAASPTATDGAPVVTTGGVVLGGNSRVMTARRVENYAVYTNYLRSVASTFGINADDLARFRKPFLIRETSVDLRECARYSNLLNKSLTQDVDVTTEAVSYQRQLSQGALEEIGDVFAQADAETISEALGDRRVGDKIVKVFRMAGIITSHNASQWIDPATGTFSDLGRLLVEKTLLARILPDKKLIDAARNYTSQITKSIPLIIRMQRIGEPWDLTPSIESSIRHEARRRASGVPRETYVRQIDTFSEPVDERTDIVWSALDSGPRRWKAVLEKYVSTAEHESQGTGFDFAAPLTPDEVLAKVKASQGLSDVVVAENGVTDRAVAASANPQHGEPVFVPYEPQRPITPPKAMEPIVRTFRDIGRMRVERHPIAPEWEPIWGHLPEHYTAFIYGEMGTGKTTLISRWADYVSRRNLVLWINSERPSTAGGMTDRIAREGLFSPNVHVIDTNDPDLIEKLLASGRYRLVIIDSGSGVDADEHRKCDWFFNYPNTSIIVIAQIDKKGQHLGINRWVHDPMVVINTVREGTKAYAVVKKSDFGRTGRNLIFDEAIA